MNLNILKKIVKIAGVSLVTIVAAGALLVIIQPRIPLHPLCTPLSSFLSLVTGHTQEISGRYYLVPGRWTDFSVEEGRVALSGEDGFSLKAEVDSAKSRVHLWSLLRGVISLDGLLLNGVSLDLFTAGEKEPPGEEEGGNTLPTEIPAFPLRLSGVIELADISANIRQEEAPSPVRFLLLQGNGELSNEHGGHFTMEAILNEKQFSASFESGALQSEGVRPFTLQLAHKSVAARLKGSSAGTAEDPGITVEFSLSGEHFIDLASVLGHHGSEGQPFQVEGSIQLSAEEIEANFSRVLMGGTDLVLSASVRGRNEKYPRFALAVPSGRLDVDGLGEFLSPNTMATRGSAAGEKKTIFEQDDILFPTPFPIQNLKLELDLQELLVTGKSIRDIHLRSSMENGVAEKASFSATFGNSNLFGHYSLDFSRQRPEFSAHLDSSSLDIGSILEGQELAKGLAFQLDKVKIDLEARGRTPAELVNSLTFSIHSGEGRYEYRHPETGGVLPVSIQDTRIVAVPGDRITVESRGRIADTPVTISMELEDLRGRQSQMPASVSFGQNILFEGAELALSGSIPLPYSGSGTTVNCRFAGEELSSLNDLLKMQLPNIGPYSLSGQLMRVPEGYRLEKIELQVGSSLLAGDAHLDTQASPPALVAEIEGDTIQLDDFKAIWMGEEGDEKEVGREDRASEDISGDEGERPRPTDQEVLNRYDALVGVTVKEVLSGSDYLGRGVLKAEQKGGRLQISPLRFDFPKGSAQMYFVVEPSGESRRYSLNVAIDDLDYGLIGRWFKPDSTMDGSLSLRISLDSESPDSENIMANGTGSISFLVLPRELQAGVIDIWAVNLLSYLGSLAAPQGESQINCAAGRFILREGILSRDELIIDTSKIRIGGDLSVDFHKQWIEGRLRPRPKRPQFFSLATPIQISGRLEDLEVGVAPGGGISTLVRLAAESITVPLQWLVLNKLPEDGTADCLQLMIPKEERVRTERPHGGEWYSNPQESSSGKGEKGKAGE